MAVQTYSRGRDAGRAVLTPSPGVVAVLLLLGAAAALLGLLVGRSGLLDLREESLIFSMRACRVLVAFFAGGALAVAGAVVQTLFRNPLASPEILGTSAGATLGAHIALLVSVLMLGGAGTSGIAPEMLIPVGATLGALISLVILLTVVSLREDALALLLTGYALMTLFVGASSFLTSVTQESWEMNRAFAALSQGDISSVGPRQVLLIMLMTIGGVAPIALSHSTLDVLLSGDHEARTLGVDVTQTRIWLVLWVSLLTAGAVAVGGAVGFVGLIVPHALRPWAGQRHRYLLPAVFAGGGGFVVLCDVLCRIAPIQHGIPLGIFTNLIGAPVFLRLLLRELRGRGSV